VALRRLLGITAFLSTALLAQIPREAPDLLLTDTTGRLIQLSTLRGKAVVMEFMLTTCPHCQDTARMLSRLAQEYGPQGLQVIGVAFDGDARRTAPVFAQENQLAYPLAVLSPEKVYEFAQLSAMLRHSVPILVFIDRQGKIRSQFTGDAPFFQNEEANLRAKIHELLKERHLKATGGPRRTATSRELP